MSSSIDRRGFLKVLGVTSGGAVAAAGCAPDAAEKLIPYLIPPEGQIPGTATYYASTCRECPGGCGFHAKVREGRVVKVEGNPESPINRGKLCARGQAAVQGVYNPDRITGPMQRNATGGFDAISWEDALTLVSQRLSAQGGDRIAFLTGNEAGTFDQLVSAWLRAFGSTQRVVYEPFGYEALRHANRQVFGMDSVPAYRLADAEYVISFGADFLETWVSPVEFAGAFVDGHAYHDEHMGRYVHVEPRMSMTAISADEWIAPNPGTEAALAFAMAKIVLASHGANAPSDAGRLRPLLDNIDVASVATLTGVPQATIERLAAEFAEGSSVALAGGVGAQHEQAHTTAAAVNILNYVAGNVGQTVVFGGDLNPSGGSTFQGLVQLTESLAAGNIDVLLIHGANPVHTAPVALGMANAIGRAGFKVSFSRYLDETAALADVILPDHDPLEQWNDYRPRSGVYALQQPTMQPVFDTRQTGDVLLALARQTGGTVAAAFPQASYKDYLQAQWRTLQTRLGDRQPFEDFWTESLQHGGVYRDATPQRVTLASTASDVAAPNTPTFPNLALIAYPSSVMYDGRGANRPWLQELPDPVSKITWGSWVEVHPETARELNLADGDFVELTSAAGAVTTQVYVYPGIKAGVLAMPIGQGHTSFGRYANNVGANVYQLLSATPTAFGGASHYIDVELRATGAHERLASTTGSPRQLGRGIAQSTTLHEVEEGHFHPFHVAHAAEVPEHIEEVLDQWQEGQEAEWKRGNYAGQHPSWGLSVDLSRCTGCSACVTACYAENNIATVGKAGVQRGREMSWMRIERYFEGGENGEPLHIEVLPMMCQQCNRAPCEPVCPVFAAYHTPDGLNGQVYNRCVGTRYCANNCPYKVRYFNWFDHGNQGDPAAAWPEPMPMGLNPDVVVRSKGVMEKCTFCIQRIRTTQHQAALEGRSVQDGEIQTACQQTCPSKAIVFGDLRDSTSEVSRMAASPMKYRVLEGLNTDPSVAYLTKVRNVEEA